MPSRLYDRLILQRKEKDFSLWIGLDGSQYFFKHLQKGGEKQPIAAVFRNRKYLSGLFPTKRVGEFSADILRGDKKHLLVFKVKSAKEIEILEVENSS